MHFWHRKRSVELDPDHRIVFGVRKGCGALAAGGFNRESCVDFWRPCSPFVAVRCESLWRMDQATIRAARTNGPPPTAEIECRASD